MSRTPRQTLWAVVKLLLAGLVVGFVGWQFTLILSQESLWESLQQHPLDLRWPSILASIGLYLAGLACWGGFWVALVRHLGQPLPWWAGYRAYFVSQLGKYVPGKALVVILRVGMVTPVGVSPVVATVTGVYETLTVMASGTIVAFSLLPFTAPNMDIVSVYAMLLLPLTIVPLIPGVADRLTAKAARPFLAPDSPPLPPFTWRILLRGLAHGVVGWLLLGASLWTFLQPLGLNQDQPPPTPLLYSTGAISLAYVVGFVTLVSPGGLGVRELILHRLLAPSGLRENPAAALAVLAVLLVRLAWTAAEFAIAALLYCVPARKVDA